MLILLVLLFLALAFTFSMLGLGGAMVYNPILVWFGFDFKEVVVPTGLLLNGLTAASAAWVYYRKGMIDFSVALPLIITSAIGAPLGAYFTQFIPLQWLLGLFAAAVVLAGGRMILISSSHEPENVRGTPRQRTIWGALLGIGIGFIAGLLGIGGGFLIVPLLMAMGYPTKLAAATSAFVVVFSSVTGFLGHLAVGHFDWQLMAALAVSVVLGSQLGAHVMHSRLKPRALKQMFGVVLLFIAGKMIWGLL
ncbi:MAG: sulfite exporter TauE/SafE family protein [Chloroflexi bacterium]|nr:MAG: sulfite exporter TauE/SafE family protein [Chloroflexota bacterium]